MSKKNLRKNKRSGNEKCEICKTETPLQEHHIRGREIPDYNNDSNIGWCCPNCHDKIHLGFIVLEGWFNTSQGRQLLWHNKNEPSITGKEISPPHYSP